MISAIDRLIPRMRWYSADTVPSLQGLPRTNERFPIHVGSASELAELAGRVEQFERGVFAGALIESTPSFREGGTYTEDPEDADLGDAVVEVRAFDTSYIEVLTLELATAESLASMMEVRSWSATVRRWTSR